MQSFNQILEINKRKSKILATMLALIIGGSITFVRNKTMSDNKDSLTARKEQSKDSIYYGCVLCCQKFTNELF
jgi:hypothetical protein